MFVLTLSKSGVQRFGAGLLCCAVVVCGAMLGRMVSTRSMAAAAPVVGRVESAQDVESWFAGHGIAVDPTGVTVDTVKIPRKWDDSFSAFERVVSQSGMSLGRSKGKTVEKWQALIPDRSTGTESCYGVLLVRKQRPVGAYLLEKPSGRVTGLQDEQAARAAAASEEPQPEPVAAESAEPAQEVSALPEEAALYTELMPDGSYPVE